MADTIRSFIALSSKDPREQANIDAVVQIIRSTLMAQVDPTSGPVVALALFNVLMDLVSSAPAETARQLTNKLREALDMQRTGEVITVPTSDRKH